MAIKNWTAQGHDYVAAVNAEMGSIAPGNEDAINALLFGLAADLAEHAPFHFHVNGEGAISHQKGMDDFDVVQNTLIQNVIDQLVELDSNDKEICFLVYEDPTGEISAHLNRLEQQSQQPQQQVGFLVIYIVPEEQNDGPDFNQN